MLLAVEAGFHFIFPSITLYGMWEQNVWDWKIAITPFADLFFGIVCSLGSYLLGIKHEH